MATKGQLCLVFETMADSFPEFEDSEITIEGKFRNYQHDTRHGDIISLYNPAGLKANDTMQILLAMKPDNSTSKWRFLALSKKKSRMAPLGIRHFGCSNYRTYLSTI